MPASIPPPAGAAPSFAAPDATPPNQPTSDVSIPGPGPRRLPLKPKASAPRPPAAAAAPNPNPAPNAPVVSQQVAPLPPPIEVRPAPGNPVAARPKPKPPLVLTPPAAPPPPR
jgi:large subunit ribosomal protein L24